MVKRLTEGSVAEIDGRINVHDTLLKVFAVLHVSCLLLLMSLTLDLCQFLTRFTLILLLTLHKGSMNEFCVHSCACACV